jgi:nanoRNase/pAp phosphatase (c-di-AMP/oligoRNAs hydrolase)
MTRGFLASLPMPAPGHDLKHRVGALLDVTDGSHNVLVCTHDNPDPDSIASGFALGELLHARTGCSYTLAHGGVLGRAENRAMVRLLKIPLVSFSRLDPNEFDTVALVDTQPAHGNHRVTRDIVEGKRLLCIDHHPARTYEGTIAPDFADVGGDYGATSTMLTCYLDAADVPFDAPVATALFYGIKSDTRDLGREVGEVDVWAYQHLIGHTDMAVVSQIEHPRLPRGYFATLSEAVRRARCVEEVVICDLGDVYVPDLVSETADWLLLAEGVRWSIVTGQHEDDCYCSLRVSDRRFSAGKLVREVIANWENASAGGHGSMAGAKITFPHDVTKAKRAQLRRKLLRQLMRATGVDKDARPRSFATSGDTSEST